MSQFIPIEEMSLDGYQIVNAGLFHHPARKCEATCTVWPSRISFNKLALEKLHYCDYIKIQVNPTTKCLLVCPVTSSDKDGIRWIKGERKSSCVIWNQRLLASSYTRSGIWTRTILTDR